MKTLRDRRLKPSENSPELEESIQRLTHLGYLTAPRDVTEALANDYFTDALPDIDMRLRIQQSHIDKTLANLGVVHMLVNINCLIDTELKHAFGCCFCYMNVQLDKVFGTYRRK